ncbi:hypothetical protein [Leyella stercorea]|uniref:hypothetical protein n=1 Tax=Leyella stercorea TaxID=363265 RepID=UPI00242C63FA|nr:hypothetical protein [Leyella stercorea]
MKSVGGHLSRRFCEFGVFCGIISHSRWRGYGKMPYPPKEKSMGGKRFPQNARNAQKLLAEKSLPQMAQMSTDVGGYGIPAIPTLPNSVYSVNSVGEQRTLTSVQICEIRGRLFSAGGSVNSAYSVGEYPIAGGVGMARCHTLLRRNPWEDT